MSQLSKQVRKTFGASSRSNPHQDALDQLTAQNNWLNSAAGRKWIAENNTPYSNSSTNNVSANGTIGEGTRLRHYTGETAVPLAAGQQEMIDTVRNLLNGSQGNLRQLLAGQFNQGQFEAGVGEPMRQSLQNTIQPKVNEAYSGSGTGSSFFSGARQNEQQNQSNALQTELAKLRYQGQQDATATSLQAMGQLTGLNSILSMETANDVDNMARQIATHYKNQGLTAEQAGIDLSNVIQRMNQQNQTFNQGIAERKMTLEELLGAQRLESNAQTLARGSGQGGISTRIEAPASWNQADDTEAFFAKVRENNMSDTAKAQRTKDQIALAKASSGKSSETKGWWNS